MTIVAGVMVAIVAGVQFDVEAAPCQRLCSTDRHCQRSRGYLDLQMVFSSFWSLWLVAETSNLARNQCERRYHIGRWVCIHTGILGLGVSLPPRSLSFGDKTGMVPS